MWFKKYLEVKYGIKFIGKNRIMDDTAVCKFIGFGGLVTPSILADG